MPQALAYLPEIVTSLFEVGTSSLVLTAAYYGTYALELVALNGLVQSLAPKSPTPEALRQTYRQAIPPRRRGCGHARLGGPYLLDYAADSVLHRVIAIADCPVTNIDQYWLHQDTVRLVAGVVQSLPNGAYDQDDERVKIAATFGVTGTPAFTALHTEVGDNWASTASGTGIFMAYIRCQSPKLQYFAHDYPHGQDPQLNLAGDINVFYDWRNMAHDIGDPSTWSPSKNNVVCLVNELWRYHDYDWDADFAPTLSILTDEADVCDELVPILVILAKITLDVTAGDSSVHLAHIDGLVSGTTIFIAGQTFTVSGSPTSDGDGGYLVDLSGSIVAGLATGAVASWNSDPDDPVTRPRYAAGGAWNADESESDTTKRLLDAMDGFMVRRGSDNAVIIRAGHWIEPTIILGADELLDYTWQPFVETARAVNELVTAYSSPAHDYAVVDSGVWQNEDDISARGLVSSQPFAPELCQENNQLMRLAKAKMTRLSVSTETFKFKASALRVIEAGARWVRLQAGLDELSDLADVYLEIGDDFRIEDNGMSVVLTVRKADAGLYDFDYLTEEGEGPADASRPYAPPLPQPSIDTVSAFGDALGSGLQGVRLAIDAVGPDRADLNWSWRWRIAGDTAWRDTTTTQTSGGTVTMNTDFVPVDVDLEVAVAYQTGIGTLSPWSATTTTTITGADLDAIAAGLGVLAELDTVDGSTIDSSSVATHHLTTDAVTDYEFKVDTNVTVDTSSEVAIISQAITTTGGRIGIRAAIFVSDAHSGSHIIRIYEGATKIAEIGYLQATNQSHAWPIIYLATPAAGTVTYEIRLFNFSGDSTIVMPFIAMELTEYKR